MKLPAADEPAIWNTSVKGDVAEVFLERPGVLYGMFRPMSMMERT